MRKDLKERRRNDLETMRKIDRLMVRYFGAAAERDEPENGTAAPAPEAAD
jgi:hypothetical protein